ncbi:MAG: hypothetical protein GAK35_01099 [Herbaspirillum frisingense]|uniref:Uncharacterized protein n=1 Tax=Herbaspirillum frisingense TaxID=92645 RepID=A0A7V8FYX2_9BURK|nr:MAG: hypothetical protein GAK35_01099 [Herbaspirillum frisingense]
MKKTINLAVAAALLLSQSAWVPQVLAAKSSLSISAVVTGQCRIRVAENDLGYRIECSGGAPHPQIQTSSGMDSPPHPTTAPRACVSQEN